MLLKRISRSPDLIIREPFISTDSTARGTACYTNRRRNSCIRRPLLSEIRWQSLFSRCRFRNLSAWTFSFAEKSGASASDTAIFLEEGFIRCDARWSWSSKGAVIYASGTSGGLTDLAPTGSNDGIQAVGIVETADIVKFKPDLLIIELK